jgi:hypothetical protein
MQFCLPNIINTTYSQSLTEVILPPIQNVVEICKQTNYRKYRHFEVGVAVTNAIPCKSVSLLFQLRTVRLEKVKGAGIILLAIASRPALEPNPAP